MNNGNSDCTWMSAMLFNLLSIAYHIYIWCAHNEQGKDRVKWPEAANSWILWALHICMGLVFSFISFKMLLRLLIKLKSCYLEIVSFDSKLSPCTVFFKNPSNALYTLMILSFLCSTKKNGFNCSQWCTIYHITKMNE